MDDFLTVVFMARSIMVLRSAISTSSNKYKLHKNNWYIGSFMYPCAVVCFCVLFLCVVVCCWLFLCVVVC
jgi:hypothetical protein